MNAVNMSSFEIYDNLYLYGAFPTEIVCSWTSLASLKLYSNHFTGTFPSCLSDTIGLFDMSNNMFTGSFPDFFCDINLGHLDFTGNMMTGSIPNCIGENYQSINYFSVDNNFLAGTLPVSMCKWHEMRVMHTVANYFTGSLPSCFADWNEICEFYMWGNYYTGSIADHWCDHYNLQIFDIRTNLMTGSFPACVWNVSDDLRLVAIQENFLTGPLFVSEELSCSAYFKVPYYSPRLQYITANHNNFTGSIPSCIGTLFPELQNLDISATAMHGKIPDSLCQAVDLYEFEAYASHLTGTFPDCWSEKQTNLQQFSLGDNLLHGTLPQTLCNLVNLASLLIGSNEFTGTIPSCYGAKLTQMKYFNLSSNHLNGSLPMKLCGMQHSAVYFAAQDNRLEGSIPPCFGDFKELQYFLLSRNMLSGPLSFLRYGPGMIKLEELSLAYNQLTGPLFMDLINISTVTQQKRELSQLLVQQNRFSGSLPSSSWEALYNIRLKDIFGKLQVVDLSQNEFTGYVDSALFTASASSLTGMVLTKNCFSGQLSPGMCLHGESLLEVLGLDGLSAGCNPASTAIIAIKKVTAMMHGSIPSCIFALPNLKTFHAAGNDFTGSLPEGGLLVYYYYGSNLTDLSLSHNKLHGSIPASIQRRAWTNLDLAFNKLDGFLIESDNTSQWMNSGSSVKLQRNRLSGNIPKQYLQAENVVMLNGNLFACQGDAQHRLPRQDPEVGYYSCGSDTLNVVLSVGVGLMFAAGLGLWLWITRSSGSNSTSSNDNDQQTQTESQKPQQQQTTQIISEDNNVYPLQHHLQSNNNSTSDEEEMTGGGAGDNTAASATSEEKSNRDYSSSTSPTHSFHSSSSSSVSSKDKAFIELRERCRGSVQVLRSDVIMAMSSRTEPSNSRSSGSDHKTKTNRIASAAEPTDNLISFLQICDHQRRLYLTIASLFTVIMLPVHVILDLQYKTHSSAYAWVVSAAYLGGLLPAIILCSLWLIVFVLLYRSMDPNSKFRGRRIIAVKQILRYMYRLQVFWQEYSAIGVALVINAALLLVVNGVYVYLVVRHGRVLSLSLQILLVAFKIVYNGRLVSKLVRGSEWLQRLQKRQQLLKKGLLNHSLYYTNEYAESKAAPLLEAEAGGAGLIPGIYSEAALVVFNLVLVPIIAGLCVDSNCFYEVLVPPPPLQTSLTVESLTPSYSFSWQNEQATFSTSSLPLESTVDTVFAPPFTYSGQCASSIISTYEPVFVLLYLVNLFLLPAIRFLRRAYYSKPEPKEAETAEHCTMIEKVIKMSKTPEILRSLSFNRRTYVVTRVTNLAVLLTFGWAFAPLAVLIALVEVRDSMYITAALQQYIADLDGGMTAAKKELNVHLTGIAFSLPYLQLRFLLLGSMALGMLLYDTAADEQGLQLALWAPLLMAFGPWLVDQLLLTCQRYCGSAQRGVLSSSHRLYIDYSMHNEDDDVEYEEKEDNEERDDSEVHAVETSPFD